MEAVDDTPLNQMYFIEKRQSEARTMIPPPSIAEPGSTDWLLKTGGIMFSFSAPPLVKAEEQPELKPS